MKRRILRFHPQIKHCFASVYCIKYYIYITYVLQYTQTYKLFVLTISIKTLDEKGERDLIVREIRKDAAANIY